jgi:para-nitrobenzyl esterase
MRAVMAAMVRRVKFTRPNATMAPLASAAVLLLALAPLGSAAPPVAKLDGGELRGLRAGSVSQFLGVPFAQPPTGDRRWRPPTLPEPWPTPLDATQYKPACAQGGNAQQAPGAGPSREDCLYLDIYTPASLDGAATAPKLAVVLFVHGGGFMNGDSAGGGGPGGIFNGTEMAAAQQVVVVSVNYRMCDAHAARLARMTVCSACRLPASTRAELRICVRAAHPH